MWPPEVVKTVKRRYLYVQEISITVALQWQPLEIAWIMDM